MSLVREAGYQTLAASSCSSTSPLPTSTTRLGVAAAGAMRARATRAQSHFHRPLVSLIILVPNRRDPPRIAPVFYRARGALKRRGGMQSFAWLGKPLWIFGGGAAFSWPPVRENAMAA